MSDDDVMATYRVQVCDGHTGCVAMVSLDHGVGYDIHLAKTTASALGYALLDMAVKV